MYLTNFQKVSIFGSFLLCLQMASAFGGFSRGTNERGSFQFSSFFDYPNKTLWSFNRFAQSNPSPHTRSNRSTGFGSNLLESRLFQGPLSNRNTYVGYQRSFSWGNSLYPGTINVKIVTDSIREPPIIEENIQTADYFRSAQDIPMKLYNTVVCAVFKEPSKTQEPCCQTHSSEKNWKKFLKDIEDIPIRYQITPYRYFEERYYALALRKVKALLYGGMDLLYEQVLRHALHKWLNYKDLELIFSHVFGPTAIYGKIAKKQLGLFYVSCPQSTIDRLASKDRKRLDVDLILAANRKLACPFCGTIFYSSDQVVNVVSNQLLPRRISGEKKRKALNAIKFISEAKLTSAKVSKLLGNLVKSHQEGSLDVEMTCKVLGQAKATSKYCGVRKSACQLYDKLNCASWMGGQNNKDDDSGDDGADGNDRDFDTGSVDPFHPFDSHRTTTSTTIKTTTKPTTTIRTTTTAPTTSSARRPPLSAPQCGVSDTASRMFSVQTAGLLTEARIVGGFVAGTCTTYPWMVRILIPSIGNTCGGAILDERHVLTAAHCLLFTDKIQVFVGDYDRANVEGTEQIIDVAIPETNNKALHPEYNYGRQVNDIAVVTLDTPINLDRICATPLCLDPDFQIKEDMKCVAAGWGLTNETARTGEELMRAASIPTFDSAKCRNLFPDIYMSDPAHQICAGEPDVGGVDTCGGDSGSPLFCLDNASGRWVAVGVVNYGEGCARAGYAGVYADVREYIPWIISRMAD